MAKRECQMLLTIVAFIVGLNPTVRADDSWHVDGAHGTITVRGQLNESSCWLEMRSLQQSVIFNGLATSQFHQPGDHAQTQYVDLYLRDCPGISGYAVDERTGQQSYARGQPFARLMFDAERDENSPQWVRLWGISGLALRLTDVNGRQMRLGSSESPVYLVPGQNILRYGLTPVRTAAPLHAGEFRANVRFTLDYN